VKFPEIIARLKAIGTPLLVAAYRLRGISIPIGGISWDPPELDVTAARRVLTFLEDRRVLYDPARAEFTEYCITSVLEIRRFLTETLAGQERGEELTTHLKAMRGAGRRFLSWFGPNQPDPRSMSQIAPPLPDDPSQYDLRGSERQGFYDPILNQALGELRAAFGFHIAQIAVKYGFDLEDDLAQLAYTVDTALPADLDEERPDEET
jgi:hypothetical protein